MEIVQAIIIYLACGFPFGVNSFLEAGPNDTNRLFRASAVTLFWFAFLPGLLHTLVTSRLIRPGSEASDRTALVESRIRSASRTIEDLAAESGSPHGTYQIRDLVERFCGLSALTHESLIEDQPISFRLSEIGDHPDSSLAGAVIARNNRLAIKRHHKRAFKELLNLYTELASGSGRDREIRDAFESLIEISGNYDLALPDLEQQEELDTLPKINLMDWRRRWSSFIDSRSQKKRSPKITVGASK